MMTYVVVKVEREKKKRKEEVCLCFRVIMNSNVSSYFSSFLLNKQKCQKRIVETVHHAIRP